MSALAETIPVDELAAQARQARPGHGLVTVITAIFVGFGWAIGAVVTGIAFAGLCLRYGYQRGRGLTDEEITVRAAAKAVLPEQQPQRSPRSSKL